MSILEQVSESEATGEIAAIYGEDAGSLGYVAAHTKVLAYRAWEGLIRAIAGSMDPRRYELVTLAAALGIGSRHCRLAHGRKALPYIGEEELTAIARDYRTAGLSSPEVAMMIFAEKMSTESASMTDADALALRAEGFTDPEIVEIALAAAARNYLSRVLQALGADVDVPPGLSATLTSALLDPLP
ncbi:carboxymuconolactone decarboxylase family protein [Arthrobacter bussei]|uniref:Carboxymuconolactone decarboxylase family protein n=1 Tax=Arthrobacter bussei TaxID=2594179 RepID=A0A7X1NQ49_9MICC|nr:carboxymuconolactone decarboxylase family protein [Arthrobacter bussei]